jgi:hypothetical protein
VERVLCAFRKLVKSLGLIAGNSSFATRLDARLWYTGEIFSCNDEVTNVNTSVVSCEWWLQLDEKTSDVLFLLPVLSVKVIRVLLVAGDTLPVVRLFDFNVLTL